MERTRLYLLRHGQVEGFEEKRYNGQADVALTALGERQSLELARRLAQREIGAVYGSDLRRCVFAAEAIAREHGLAPVFETHLRERHIGAWEGLTWRQLQSEHPEQWQGWLADIVHFQPPGGESLEQVAARVRPALAALVARHPGEEIVVAAHGGVNRIILLDAIGAPLRQLFHIEQDYGCLNIIDYYADGNAVVGLLNG